MTVESLTGFTLGVMFIVALAFYMNTHRAEDHEKRHKRTQNGDK